jgi:hypothetical protein
VAAGHATPAHALGRALGAIAVDDIAAVAAGLPWTAAAAARSVAAGQTGAGRPAVLAVGDAAVKNAAAPIAACVARAARLPGPAAIGQVAAGQVSAVRPLKHIGGCVGEPIRRGSIQQVTAATAGTDDQPQQDCRQRSMSV